ncbi:YwqG family protein [Bradyrhizobium sp. GCM10027634]|uniref:YwqG family protein n=1 Tax=unclassified Bradyrhizobium TaxID=2631580 RepID=UPI00188BD29A|nr:MULTISPECIES: YwqG family protein [unclassified Bradyrhizobium]MDN5000498.1 YwqG family protein [Bradyrhizobium sp. WYCCWR 12677]
MSFFIALLMIYVVGCMAAAVAAVFALEWIVGDIGALGSVLVFSAILLGLVSQATRIFEPLMVRRHAKDMAGTKQHAAAAELPVWANEAELEAALRHAGLNEWAPRLAQMARRCIVLVPGPIEEGAPTGASRLGGQPDMPPDVDWPFRPAFTPKREAGSMPGRIISGRRHRAARLEHSGQVESEIRNREWPLSFVAQIDFAELHSVCALDGFPSAGRLLFFCDPFDWPWGEEEDQARARTIFTRRPGEQLQRKPFPKEFDEPAARELMPRGYAFKPRSLRPTAWLLPPPVSSIARFDWPGWSVAQRDAYQQFWDALYARYPEVFGPDGNAGIHQVGGVALSIQEPVEAACAGHAGDGPEFADNWQLVLQIDSDVEAGMEWGDAGRLYLCARKQDLATDRFDRCWTILQSH